MAYVSEIEIGGRRMTNKRYTDEEIISSLEVIATTCNCNECKLRNGKWGACNCSETTANAALDLINRQRAEIEKMRGSTIVSNIMESQRIKREAKAEAYKEFAEIIKDKWFDNRYDSPDIDFDDFIDNLLKEMAGVTDNYKETEI